LMECVGYAMKEAGLLEYKGDPVVECELFWKNDEKNNQTKKKEKTAYVGLRSKEEARNLVTLNGKSFNGAPLRLELWDEDLEGDGDDQPRRRRSKEEECPESEDDDRPRRRRRLGRQKYDQDDRDLPTGTRDRHRLEEKSGRSIRHDDDDEDYHHHHHRYRDMCHREEDRRRQDRNSSRYEKGERHYHQDRRRHEEDREYERSSSRHKTPYDYYEDSERDRPSRRRSSNRCKSEGEERHQQKDGHRHEDDPEYKRSSSRRVSLPEQKKKESPPLDDSKQSKWDHKDGHRREDDPEYFRSSSRRASLPEQKNNESIPLDDSKQSKGVPVEVYVNTVPPVSCPEELVKFLNQQMKKHELCLNDAIVSHRELAVGTIAIVAASKGLAESLMYLNEIRFDHSTLVKNGIRFKHSTLVLSRRRDYRGPSPKFKTYSDFLKYNGSTNSTNFANAKPNKSTDMRVDLLVFVKGKHGTEAPEVICSFLNDTLKGRDLLADEEQGVVACHPSRTPLASWVLETATEEVAEKVMFLNGLEMAKRPLELSRHHSYDGPPPKFDSFQEFEKDRKSIRPPTPPRKRPDATSTPLPSGPVEARWVFLSKNANGMPPEELIKFFNETIRKKGLAEEKAISSFRRTRSRCWCLEMVTEDLAAKLVNLNGIRVQDYEIRLSRHHKHYQTPHNDNGKELLEKKQGQSHTDHVSAESDSKIPLLVNVREDPPVSTSEGLVEFINKQMQELELCKGDAVVQCRKLSPSSAVWVLEAASADVATNLMHLNRIRLNQSTLAMRRNHYYKGPRPKYLTYKEFLTHHQADKEAAKIVVQVLLHQEPPEHDTERLMEFLNTQMKKLELCDDNAIVSCTHLHSNIWMLETATEELAGKLVHLNRIRLKLSSLFLSRHNQYQGPPPEFTDYYEFVNHRHDKTDSPRKRVAANTAADEGHPTRKKENRSSNSNITAEMEAPPHSNSSQLVVDAYIQKQELGILQQVTSCNLENDRLKKELSKIARDHITLKQEFGRISEENEQLKANKEMEQGFRQVSGSEQQPIDLIADATDAKTQTKEASETSKKGDADQIAEVVRLTTELTTTQQQVAAVHQSWQEQHQQLMEQQRQMNEMALKLEDSERRFWNVTESLALQTNELANERQMKRKLEEALSKERDRHKETKRKARGFASLKSESNCDV
jgi:hypothetical protein